MPGGRKSQRRGISTATRSRRSSLRSYWLLKGENRGQSSLILVGQKRGKTKRGPSELGDAYSSQSRERERGSGLWPEPPSDRGDFRRERSRGAS